MITELKEIKKKGARCARTEEKMAYWLWYPGDFEIYHALLQNFSREERGFDWPAFWYQADCRRNVRFSREYELEKETEFTVYSHSQGYVTINGRKRLFGEKLTCGPGRVRVEIFAGRLDALPAVFVEGERICSGAGWEAWDFTGETQEAGWSARYCKKEQDPAVWEYESVRVKPVSETEKNGGILYDFGRELTAVVHLGAREASVFPLTLCYGESEAEALDTEYCYYSQTLHAPEEPVRKRAFRYVFVPGKRAGELEAEAEHFYVDIPVKADFKSKDRQLEQIWQVCEETFRLCSGVFFIDGIKRDRWIWSGDALQSYLVNFYLMFDEEINKRTILGLRGDDPVRQHINTIVDYSMYWIISLDWHYQRTGDLDFVRMTYPKAVSMMEFLEKQLDENGFLVGRPGDWIFIDWAEMDKGGPLCAEQMLLAVCYRTMEKLERLATGEAAGGYAGKAEALLEKIERFYWLEERQAYIDCFSTGKNSVTRHANIFAVFFGLVGRERAEAIYTHVLANDRVPQITTPYFKFYELEVLCRLGRLAEVLERMKAYWGAILQEDTGAVWEEYDPAQTGPERYAMYGDRYGKSLCHAWGASPIYLLGRYFMGVAGTAVADETFEVCPHPELLEPFCAAVPVKNGLVRLNSDGKTLTVCADRDGGVLRYGGVEYVLQAGREVRVEMQRPESV
ncbi:MAG: alpha-L-rhamnosidase [Eubacteriales bacterium]|nr:alpha-L-rhamnosidase [Eubacteriales bacterium]